MCKIPGCRRQMTILHDALEKKTDLINVEAATEKADPFLFLSLIWQDSSALRTSSTGKITRMMKKRRWTVRMIRNCNHQERKQDLVNPRELLHQKL